MTFSTQKNIAFGYRKTRYRYLAVLYLFSFFGDIFLRLHLRDLCYTGHNERLKNRDYFHLIDYHSERLNERFIRNRHTQSLDMPNIQI